MPVGMMYFRSAELGMLSFFFLECSSCLSPFVPINGQQSTSKPESPKIGNIKCLKSEMLFPAARQILKKKTGTECQEKKILKNEVIQSACCLLQKMGKLHYVSVFEF